MILESTLGYSGHYTIMVHRADGTVRNVYKFKNLITNTGMDVIRTGELMYNTGCKFLVGSGNTPPQFTDNSMQSFVAGWPSDNTINSSVNQVGGYGSRVIRGVSAQGQAAGNLSEVGLSTKVDNTGKLFSRALILDGNGQPTTITVLPIEFLTISYELRCYWPTSDTTDTVVDSGTTYSVLGRAANTSSARTWATNIGGLYDNGLIVKGFAGGDIGTVASQPTGYGMEGLGQTIGAYTSGTYYNDDSIIVPINNWNNASLLQCVLWETYSGSFQYKFTPSIAKDNTKTLELHRRISWARV